jgi:hypothetical protein
MPLAPLGHLVGHVGELRAEDERQPRRLDRASVGLRDHPGVRDHGHVGQLMRLLERGDRRDHRVRLGLVALERLDHQREPGRVGQQAYGDLRLEPALFRVARLAEPVALIGLEVERRHVMQDQRCRTQRRVLRARGCKVLPPRRLGVNRQPPLERRVRGRRDPSLGQHPQRVDLAGRLDDPREHQLPKHLVPAGRLLEAEPVVGAAQRVPQMRHPRRLDRQRPGRACRVQAEIEFALTSR